MSYGVMVAQQVLVLFVLVRIQVGQHKKGLHLQTFFVLYVISHLMRIIKVLVCCDTKHLDKVFTSLPTCLGQVHKQIIAAIACRSTRHLALIRSNELECLQQQRQDIGRSQIAFHYKIIACQATHRTPIDYLIGPHGMVSQERSCKMFYRVYCARAKHRFAVWLFHAHIKSGYHLAAYNIFA